MSKNKNAAIPVQAEPYRLPGTCSYCGHKYSWFKLVNPGR